jgi:hypothetical protein
MKNVTVTDIKNDTERYFFLLQSVPIKVSVWDNALEEASASIVQGSTVSHVGEKNTDAKDDKDWIHE